MYKNWIIYKHYLRRAATDILGLLLSIILPIGIITIYALVYVEMGLRAEHLLIDGYDVWMTINVFATIIMFQFFGGMWINEWIYDDFRGTNRWRLFSAPVSQNRVFFMAAAANWTITVAQGLFLLLVSVIFFDVYAENYIFWIPVLILLAAIAQAIYIIIASFAEKKKTAEMIGYITIFTLSVMGGMFFSLGERADEILRNIPTPFSAAIRAVYYSGLESEFHETCTRVAAENLLILVGMLAVLVIIAALLGKRRRSA